MTYCDFEVYINHLDELVEDMKISFGDFDNVHTPEWLATQFDMKIDNTDYESDLEDRRFELHVDVEAKSLLRS